MQPAIKPAAQRNFTDPDGHILKGADGWLQGCNAQAAVDGDHGCAVAQLRWRGPIASLFEHETGAPEGQSDDDDDDGGGSHGRTSGCGWVRIENPVGTAVEKRSASTPWFTAVLVKVKVCVEPPSL